MDKTEIAKAISIDPLIADDEIAKSIAVDIGRLIDMTGSAASPKGLYRSATFNDVGLALWKGQDNPYDKAKIDAYNHLVYECLKLVDIEKDGLEYKGAAAGSLEPSDSNAIYCTYRGFMIQLITAFLVRVWEGIEGKAEHGSSSKERG